MMSQDSKIQWTDHTFNPWWGCTKVSAGCAKCYADTFAKRVGQKVWGDDAPRRFFGDKHWAEPVKWNRDAEKAGIRARVFSGSMCDVFESRDDLVPHRQRLLRLIDATPWLDWQLLTKRPENILALTGQAVTLNDRSGDDATVVGRRWFESRRNVWQGTSVEDQKAADERIPHLLRVPAAVRFLSCEPLLGEVDLDGVRYSNPTGMHVRASCIRNKVLPAVNWVIVGGESGPGARPCYVEWIRSIVRQCKTADVPVFAKQLGAKPTGAGRCRDCADDGPICPNSGLPCAGLKDPKGGTPEEWPADLRIRQMPGTAVAR